MPTITLPSGTISWELRDFRLEHVYLSDTILIEFSHAQSQKPKPFQEAAGSSLRLEQLHFSDTATDISLKYLVCCMMLVCDTAAQTAS